MNEPLQKEVNKTNFMKKKLSIADLKTSAGNEASDRNQQLCVTHCKKYS